MARISEVLGLISWSALSWDLLSAPTWGHDSVIELISLDLFAGNGTWVLCGALHPAPRLQSRHGWQWRGAAQDPLGGWGWLQPEPGPWPKHGLPARGGWASAGRRFQVHHHWVGQGEELARLRDRCAPPGWGKANLTEISQAWFRSSMKLFIYFSFCYYFSSFKPL